MILATYLKGELNDRIIHFISEYFRERKYFEPTIFDVLKITDDEIMQSWLSMPSSKELMLFQQKIRHGLE